MPGWVAIRSLHRLKQHQPLGSIQCILEPGPVPAVALALRPEGVKQDVAPPSSEPIQPVIHRSHVIEGDARLEPVPAKCRQANRPTGTCFAPLRKAQPESLLD